MVTFSTLIRDHFTINYPSLQDTLSDEVNRVTIRRNHIWKDAIRALSRPTFDPTLRVRVTFVGEEAVDGGGPCREFFCLALQEIADDGTIFQGPLQSRFLVHNLQALASRKFFYAGMMIAISLANGGPQFACLAEALYVYLCHGFSGNYAVDVSLIPDHEIQGKLQQVSLNLVTWKFMLRILRM